jgi:hypothetical protein
VEPYPYQVEEEVVEPYQVEVEVEVEPYQVEVEEVEEQKWGHYQVEEE